MDCDKVILPLERSLLSARNIHGNIEDCDIDVSNAVASLISDELTLVLNKPTSSSTSPTWLTNSNSECSDRELATIILFVNTKWPSIGDNTEHDYFGDVAYLPQVNSSIFVACVIRCELWAELALIVRHLPAVLVTDTIESFGSYLEKCDQSDNGTILGICFLLSSLLRNQSTSTDLQLTNGCNKLFGWLVSRKVFPNIYGYACVGVLSVFLATLEDSNHSDWKNFLEDKFVIAVLSSSQNESEAVRNLKSLSVKDGKTNGPKGSTSVLSSLHTTCFVMLEELTIDTWMEWVDVPYSVMESWSIQQAVGEISYHCLELSNSLKLLGQNGNPLPADLLCVLQSFATKPVEVIDIDVIIQKIKGQEDSEKKSWLNRLLKVEGYLNNDSALESLKSHCRILDPDEIKGIVRDAVVLLEASPENSELKDFLLEMIIRISKPIQVDIMKEFGSKFSMNILMKENYDNELRLMLNKVTEDQIDFDKFISLFLQCREKTLSSVLDNGLNSLAHAKIVTTVLSTLRHFADIVLNETANQEENNEISAKQMKEIPETTNHTADQEIATNHISATDGRANQIEAIITDMIANRELDDNERKNIVCMAAMLLKEDVIESESLAISIMKLLSHYTAEKDVKQLGLTFSVLKACVSNCKAGLIPLTPMSRCVLLVLLVQVLESYQFDGGPEFSSLVHCREQVVELISLLLSKKDGFPNEKDAAFLSNEVGSLSDSSCLPFASLICQDGISFFTNSSDPGSDDKLYFKVVLKTACMAPQLVLSDFLSIHKIIYQSTDIIQLPKSKAIFSDWNTGLSCLVFGESLILANSLKLFGEEEEGHQMRLEHCWRCYGVIVQKCIEDKSPSLSDLVSLHKYVCSLILVLPLPSDSCLAVLSHIHKQFGQQLKAELSQGMVQAEEVKVLVFDMAVVLRGLQESREEFGEVTKIVGGMLKENYGAVISQEA